MPDRTPAPDLTSCACADPEAHRCVTSYGAQAYHDAWQIAPDAEHLGGCWCCCPECPFDVEAIFKLDAELGLDGV